MGLVFSISNFYNTKTSLANKWVREKYLLAVIQLYIAILKTNFLTFVNLNTAKGEHPRMGALDVCPFIPVQDVSVEECVEISKKFGQKMAKELGVPVFLYGYASEKDYRKTMPQVSQKGLSSLNLRTVCCFSSY